MKHLVWALIILGLVDVSLAKDSRFKVYKQKSTERATIRNSRPLSFFYEKLSWNQEPNKIEEGYLYLRDKNTGSLTEIKLIEILPDSGVFSTEFPVGVLKQKKYATELFSPPQSMLKGKNRMGTVKQMIEDGSIKRKPFLLRVLGQKGQIVDVFDSKEKALASYNEYREKMGLSPDQLESQSIIEVTNKEKPNKKKVIDTSTLQSLFMANENDLAATVEKNRELRDVLRNMEEKRRQQVKADAKAWGQTKTDRNESKAKELIKSGVKKIKQSQFTSSVEDFFAASNLAPPQEDLYQQYGVSLFRDKKFNQSIVVLELSNPSKNRINEKNFYLGLGFFQLKDYDKAIEYFDKVIKTGDKAFASTAAFYKGSALIEQKKYEESKESFQYVLDNSDDPNMDQRAEKFIEYSIERKALEEKRSNWLNFSGVLGQIYDSNIVFASDQARDQASGAGGGVTNENGFRALTQLGVKARPWYSPTDEINITADFLHMKSFDEGFGSNPTAETADPTIISVGVPWTHRGTLGGRGYFFDLAPGYETIMMDLDGSGTATITDSITLDFNNTLVINRNWIAKGDWFFSSNDSNILGDESSADSITAGLTLSSIFILNKDLERYLIPEFGYRVNDAEGSNFAFNRFDLAISYTSAVFGEFMWNSRLGYFLANYENNRVDNNYTVTTGLSTKLGPNWNWGILANYIVNDSTTNQYQKYNVINTFSFSY